jgi:hypothetical protein
MGGLIERGLGGLGAASGLLYAPLRAGTLGAVGGANLLATQTVQRALMGDTAAQKAIAQLLQDHPESAAAIQTLIRSASTTQTGRE